MAVFRQAGGPHFDSGRLGNVALNLSQERLQTLDQLMQLDSEVMRARQHLAGLFRKQDNLMNKLRGSYQSLYYTGTGVEVCSQCQLAHVGPC